MWDCMTEPNKKKRTSSEFLVKLADDRNVEKKNKHKCCRRYSPRRGWRYSNPYSVMCGCKQWCRHQQKKEKKMGLKRWCSLFKINYREYDRSVHGTMKLTLHNNTINTNSSSSIKISKISYFISSLSMYASAHSSQSLAAAVLRCY